MEAQVKLKDEVVESTRGSDKLVAAYKAARAQVETWENVVKETRAGIEEIIGTHSGLAGAWGQILWTFNKPSLKVNWQAVAEKLLLDLPEKQRDKLVRDNTTEVPGPRVFRVTWAKELDEPKKRGAK